MSGAHPFLPLASRRLRQALGAVLTAVLLGSLMVLLPATPAVAAPAMTVTKGGNDSVLVGNQITYTLTARNTGDVPEYNLSFRDALPAGLTYVPGSTSPSSLGEPRVVVNAGQQTLIWSNVSDLPVGATQTLTFRATPGAAAYPVGSTVSNTASAYAHSDPRTVPRFSGTGDVVPGSFTLTGTSGAKTTAITAITISKSEPSPEHELLRGVHDQSTVYTLTVENNGSNATNGVTVVDYLPAQLEFLGCGTADNTAAGTVEYPGAGRLDQVPDVTADCPTPSRVETVALTAGNPQGLSAGVYTQVTWQLSNVASGATRLIRYRAGIPQRANVLFVGGPTPQSGAQAANLDNNTGASTRETTTEQALTNLATVAGTYTGTTAPGTQAEVVDSDRLTVTAEDLALVKSVSPGTFRAGGIATYTLRVRTGEYADAAGISIVDRLPDGLTPIAGSVTPAGVDFASTVQESDGSYVVTFTPLASLADNSDYRITYQARMRATYDRGDRDPTVSGDSYTNEVALTGATTTLPGVNAPSPAGTITGIRDDSAATLTSDAPSLTKTIKPQVTPYACAGGTYTDAQPATDPSVTFREGDRVCFRLRVDFSDANSTKNAVVTDFLPSYVTYEAGSATPGAANNVAADLVGSDPLTWNVGTAAGGNRFVAAGGVFDYTISGRVTAPPTGPAPDLTGNLMKLRYTSTDGTVGFLRDSVDFSVAAAPPVTVAKAATRGGSTVPGSAANPGTVAGGDVLTYTVGVTNAGTAGNRSNVAVVGPDVWDVLPAGVTCAQISSISDAGRCTDPSDAGHPSFTGNGSRSAIRWDLPDTVTIAPGTTRNLTFVWTVPPTPRNVTTFTNTAHVSTYATPTNTETLAQHQPANNIDSSLPAGSADVPAVTPAEHNVRTAALGLTKAATTDILPAADPNNAALQGVIGEGITYTVVGTVPARSSVFNGVLSDPMPTGITFLSAAAEYSADGATYTSTLPDGVTFNSANGTVTLPATYTNATATPQSFRVTIRARVADVGSNTQGVSRTNTARFASNASVGGTALTAVTASRSVTVIEPSPTLTKVVDDDTPVVGQDITYTLTPGNVAGRPILHDAFEVDCVPDGLVVRSLGTPTAGTLSQAPGDGTNGCAAGTTRIRWEIGDVAAGGTQPTATYVARITDESAGAASYVNTANLTGSSMAGVAPVERSYGASATETVTVDGAQLQKSTSTPTRAIGQRASFSVEVVLPAQVNFYDTVLRDTLPVGIDPATVQLQGATCAPACSVTATPLTSSGQRIGWTLGDLTAAPGVRTVTLDYTAVVADVASNEAGDALTNSATFGWDLANGADPTSVEQTPAQQSNTDAATVTVVEPALVIDKSVSDATPTPGDTFTYTVSVDNNGTSAAYDGTVVDTVPSGVVVDAGSISNGGVLTGADPVTGGGTITWTLPDPLTVDASALLLTYDAELASPAPLTPRVNTARVPSYRSIDGGGRTYGPVQDTATVSPELPRVVVDKVVVGGALAYIGESKGWQVTVTSDSAVTAHDVDVVDTLPVGWAYDSGSAQVSVNGATATRVNPTQGGAGDRTLTWTDLGTLTARGQTIVVTFTATPQASVATTPGVGSTVAHTNTAATTAEDANGNTSGDDGTPFNGPPDTAEARIHSADLEVEKTAADPVAGGVVTWTVTVTNNGPDPAVGPFTVTDTPPAVLTDVDATGAGWSCSGTATITCISTGSIDPGGSRTLTVSGTVPASTDPGAELVNSATVDGRTYDPEPDNDETEDAVSVTAAADLAITKTLANGPVTAGGVASYTLDVSNLGPSEHRGRIRVTDELPAGLTYVAGSAAGTGWECGFAAGTLTCDRSDVRAVGPMPQITFSAVVGSDRTAAIVNLAEVQGTTPDPVPGNNDDDASLTPRTSADLAIEKYHTAPFTAGEEGTFSFTITNLGPSDATEVVVSDELPDYLAFVRGGAGSPWTCSVAGESTEGYGGTVTCELPGRLSADATDSSNVAGFDLVVRVDPDHTGAVENAATVDSGTDDPVPGNNRDTDTTDPAAVSADLAIEKTHTPEETRAGEQVTYTLTVTNDGPSASAGPITVTDALPAGMTCVSVSAGSCSGDGATATSTRTSGLAAGGSFQVTVVARVAPATLPGILVNRASVAGPQGQDDRDPTNNSDTDDTRIITRADLTVSKTAAAQSVDAGGTIAYQVVVTNAGPSDAAAVRVAEQVPAGTTLTAISGAGWTCSVATASCDLDAPLAPGDSTPITVTLRVDSAYPGEQVTNTVQVSTTTTETDPGNNSGQDTVDVTRAADLALTKTAVAPTVSAGLTADWRLAVTNRGPSDAAGPLTITDTLPEGFTYRSVVSGAGWTCGVEDADAPRVLTCELAGGLAATRAAPVLVVRTQVAADVDLGSYTNAAEVDSPTPDPVPGNDTDTDTVTVERNAVVTLTKTHAGSDPVGIGETVTFTLDVANSGPATARDVVVTDALPTGLDLLAVGDVTGAGWDCSASDPSTERVQCARTGAPIGVGTDVEPISVTATVRAAAYPQVTNLAKVVGTNVPEDSDDDTVPVAPRADLRIEKRLVGEGLKVGTEADYSLVVTNQGPTEEPGTVSVTDVLPTGLGFVSADAGDGACAEVEGTVTCTRDGLEDGATWTIVLRVEVGASAVPSAVNTATVSGGSDPQPADNSSTVTTPVTPDVQLGIDKELAGKRGDTVTWALQVTNLGANPTTDTIRVVDTLPRSLRYVSSDGAGWTCTPQGQRVTCESDVVLEPGSTTTLRLVTRIRPGVSGEIVNLAVVSGGSQESPTEPTTPDATDDAVVDAGDPDVPGGTDTTGGGVATGGSLPGTGGPLGWLLPVGLLLVVGGALTARQRRPREAAALGAPGAAEAGRSGE